MVILYFSWLCIDLVLFILGIISNCLTIAVFTTGKRCPKSDFRALIINLCAADLLLAASLLFKHLSFVLDYTFTLSISLCRLTKFVGDFGLFASPYANLAIAIQRTLTIFRPAWNQRKSTIVVVALTWCLSFLSGLESLITSKITNSHCSIDVEGSYGGYTSLVTWIFFIRLLLPTLSIVVLYIVIGIKFYRSRRSDNSQQTSQVRRRNRILKMFFTVAIATLVAWFPANCYTLATAYTYSDTSDNGQYLIGSLIVSTLLYSNTFSSSVLYFIFDKNYRKDLAKLGCCGRGCSQNDSDSDQESDESDLEMTQYPVNEAGNQTL